MSEDTVLIVNTTADENDGGSGGSGLSLREALAVANSTPGDETIELASEAAYQLNGTELTVAATGGSVTIRGNGATIDAQETSRVIRVSSDDSGNAGNLVLQNTTVTGGTVPATVTSDTDGGGILIERGATAQLSNCTITGNQTLDSDARGGGVSNEGGGLTIDNCTISNNVSGEGGGVNTNFGNTNIIDSTVTGNVANEVVASTGIGVGGGVSHRGTGTTTIDNSTISNNSANSAGGGVHIGSSEPGTDTGSLVVTNSTISGNTAESGGGLITRVGADSSLENTIVEDNTANFGAGINVGSGADSSFLVNNSTIRNNIANAAGGGIYADNDLRVTNSTVSGNEAGSDGGGIRSNLSYVEVIDSLIDSNSAGGDGGGISDVNILQSSIVSNNTASGDGGGVATSIALIIDSTINNNSTNGSGGGVYTAGGVFEQQLIAMANSTISSNSAGVNGGGINIVGGLDRFDLGQEEDVIELFNAGVVASNITVTQNIADSNNDGEGDGGGIYNPAFFDAGTAQVIPGKLELTNSILTGNFDTPGNGAGTTPNISGPARGNGNNLVGDLAGLVVDEFFVATEADTLGRGSDLVGVDARLGQLQDNGGGIPTHGLFADSAAIDAGSNDNIFEETFVDVNGNGEPTTYDFTGDGDTDDALQFDQRGDGFQRIFNGTVDIGAYEVQADGGSGGGGSSGGGDSDNDNDSDNGGSDGGGSTDNGSGNGGASGGNSGGDNTEDGDTLELFRFRNTSFDSGTYVFVGEEEKDAILEDPNLSNTFSLDGEQSDGTVNPAFVASETPGEDLIPFYRLKSLDVPGTFLFVSTSEYDAIFDEDSDQRDKWEQEGLDSDGDDVPEFYLLEGSSDTGTSFNRFQNTQNGTYLYAGAAETEAIESDPSLSNLFENQGTAFNSL